MVEQVNDQAGPELFIATLRDLLDSRQVQILNGTSVPPDKKHIPVVGRSISGGSLRNGLELPEGEYILLVHKTALAQVNDLLRRTTGRPLPFTEATLLRQLKDKGWLVEIEGKDTKQVSIAGQRYRVLLLKRDVLKGDISVAEEMKRERATMLG